MTKYFCDICEKPAVISSVKIHDFNPEKEDAAKIYFYGQPRKLNARYSTQCHYPIIPAAEDCHLCREHMHEALKKLLAAFESGEGVIEL